MNIQRSIQPDQARPARFTAQAYVDARELINRLFQKTELRNGVIYEMPADGPLTTKWNNVMTRWLHHALSDQYIIKADKTLRTLEDWAPTPDIYVQPASIDEFAVWAKDTLLIIEISDSTLKDDLGEKAAAYAEAGVREYWVIDPNTKTLYAHHLGEDGTYGEPTQVGFTDTITAAHIPGLTLRMADLPRIS